MEKNLLNLRGLALYFLIMCIGTVWEKVSQNIANYEFKLKISECVVQILNFEF